MSSGRALKQLPRECQLKISNIHTNVQPISSSYSQSLEISVTDVASTDVDSDINSEVVNPIEDPSD